jgi:hypothetical protein
LIKPNEIQAGLSYACYFTLENIPLDEWGRPGGLLSMSDVPIKRMGTYEGFGIICTRDTEQELLEVYDNDLKRRFTVSYAAVRDIDTVDWIDQ